MLYLLFTAHNKVVSQLDVTNKMKHFSFKSGCAMQVAQLIKERLAYSVTVIKQKSYVFLSDKSDLFVISFN